MMQFITQQSGISVYQDSETGEIDMIDCYESE